MKLAERACAVMAKAITRLQRGVGDWAVGTWMKAETTPENTNQYLGGNKIRIEKKWYNIAIIIHNKE
jgi:hypothetical protein